MKGEHLEKPKQRIGEFVLDLHALKEAAKYSASPGSARSPERVSISSELQRMARRAQLPFGVMPVSRQ